VTGSNDQIAVAAQEFAKCVHIQEVMSRSKGRQVFLREFQQSHCRPQTPAVLWMRWLFEIFLQMNKCTGGLNEPLEKVVITRTSIQPKLLQDIVRIVVTLLIPA